MNFILVDGLLLMLPVPEPLSPFIVSGKENAVTGELNLVDKRELVLKHKVASKPFNQIQGDCFFNQPGNRESTKPFYAS